MTNNTPQFTDQQLQWLRQMLRPPCCYVTGEHNPTHFIERRYVCEIQRSKAYDNLRKALGFDPNPLPEATSCPPDAGCYWCNYYREK